MRRVRKSRIDRPKAAVDMNSLIDLTFLLLVVFIVTLPALEQCLPIILPRAKTDKLPPNKANVVTVDKDYRIFLNDKPTTLEKLEAQLKAMAAEDPEVPVLLRGDERLTYGSVMDVLKVIYNCKIYRIALGTVEK